MSYTQITDHVGRALGRLKTMFAGSVDLKAILTALATEVQVLEAAIFTTREVIRDPNACVTQTKSSTLNKIGALVSSRERGTLSDSRFRDLILAQVLVNKSQGTTKELCAICDSIFMATMGPIFEISDGVSVPQSSYLAGANDLVLKPELSSFLNDSIEMVRNGVAMLKAATPAGNRTILIAAVDPVNGSVPIFYLDSTALDAGAGMLCAFDSPETVR